MFIGCAWDTPRPSLPKRDAKVFKLSNVKGYVNPEAEFILQVCKKIEKSGHKSEIEVFLVGSSTVDKRFVKNLSRERKESSKIL